VTCQDRPATAILGHYIGDVHVPLHTTVNHDGQLTDQRGSTAVGKLAWVERQHRGRGPAGPFRPSPMRPHPAPLGMAPASHALVPSCWRMTGSRSHDPPGQSRQDRTTAYWMIFWAKQGPVVSSSSSSPGAPGRAIPRLELRQEGLALPAPPAG